VVDADEPASAAADQEEANEADAFWWRLRLWVFLSSISKVFRPEFDAQGVLVRVPDRDEE
jgi:hypothetical protein